VSKKKDRRKHDRDEKKTELISIRVPTEWRRMFELSAATQGRSVGYVVRKEMFEPWVIEQASIDTLDD